MGGLVFSFSFSALVISIAQLYFYQTSNFEALTIKVATISRSNFNKTEDLSYIPLLISNELKKKITVINPDPAQAPLSNGK